ncbi:cytochrome c biogenesis protein CcdA [Candidatus Berkelbacteria bacterium]|nr:cytochrome c biogenesis protein CcdA [Candidatus Berkelbacteria bacterium]
MDFSLIIPTFIAGILTFLAPCTLPLVPGYLGFISGVSRDELTDSEKAKAARRRIIKNGLLFILGFSIVFIIFGALVGVAGQALSSYRTTLTRIGGVFVIFFGLFMTGAFKLPFLQMDKRMKLPNWLQVGKPSSSFIVGAIFAFGWTPCVGPILGSVLLLASSTATIGGAIILLAVFSMGLAVPFVLVAIGFSSATKYIKAISRYLNIISVIGGIFLIVLGVLLLTNNFPLLIQYGYKALQFIHYDKILDYL